MQKASSAKSFVSEPSGEKRGGMPYSVNTRRERSRELAQKRRTTYKSIMDDLTQVLPLPKDVVLHLDYNSRLRLTLCFFRLKSLIETGKSDARDDSKASVDSEVPSQSTDVAVRKRSPLFHLGMLQDLMMEALDGFLLVLSTDGDVIYISESVHHHLGIFQSEHIGISLYEMISEDDHEEVRKAIQQAEAKALSFMAQQSNAEVSFFCRMKCSRFKVANAVTKSPGYKLVYVSGKMKVIGNDHFLVTVVHPISPPSILELRMEANMFVTHYDLTLNCLFFDGRMKHLLGYEKEDLEGRSPFGIQHHEDTCATMKCSEGIMSHGEGLSGYYRFMCKTGFYVWLQSRATLMHDSRTGKPTYIVCMNFIISKEDGAKDLKIRQAITSGATPLQEGSTHNYDPFPITQREDGSVVNPLKETSWGHKDLKVTDFISNHNGKEEEVDFVKEEIVADMGDKGSSFQTKPTMSSSSTDGSHSAPDSGVHFSTTLLSHSSASSSSSSTNTSKQPSQHPVSLDASDSGNACLPDSTTDLENQSDGVRSDGTMNVGQSKAVSGFAVCCDSSPSDGDIYFSESEIPLSVSSEGSSSSSGHLQDTLNVLEQQPPSEGQYGSHIQFQTVTATKNHSQTGGPQANFCQTEPEQVFSQNIGTALLSCFEDQFLEGQDLNLGHLSSQGLEQMGLEQMVGQGLEQMVEQQHHSSSQEYSTTSQQNPLPQQGLSHLPETPKTDGQLYQLLTQQYTDQSSVTSGSQNQTIYSGGGDSSLQQSGALGGYDGEAKFVDLFKNNAQIGLPTWNGTGSEVQIPNPIPPPKSDLYSASGGAGESVWSTPAPQRTGCIQGVWSQQQGTLPQLTNEDMKTLDYIDNISSGNQNNTSFPPEITFQARQTQLTQKDCQIPCQQYFNMDGIPVIEGIRELEGQVLSATVHNTQISW